MLRLLAVAVVVVSLAGVAAASPGDKIDPDDVIDIYDVPQTQVDKLAKELELPPVEYHLGYHFKRISFGGIDLWRSEGEFIIHDTRVAYLLDDDEVAYLGNPSVPLGYHIPPGLLIVLGLGELIAIIKTRRPAWLTIAIGGGLLVLAGVFYVVGLGAEAAVPGLLGVHHIVATLYGLRNARLEERDDEPAPEEPAPEPKPMRTEPAHSPPVIDDDPFRAPPRATIAAIQPASRPAEVPIVHDPTADKPKLLV